MPLPSKRTASRCTTEAETGTHTFEIVGYSLKKGMGVGKFVESATFAVGGYNRAIRFYPDGLIESSKEYVSIYLVLISTDAEVRARYELRLLRQARGSSDFSWSNKLPRWFRSRDGTKFGPKSSSRFCLRSDLEQQGYIRKDCLTIECDLTVVKQSQLSDIRVKSEIKVPPCDISEHLGKLLDQKDGSDVTFSVGRDTFEAHKIVLAARSPVFKALFYGQMKEARMRHVTIKDMQPAVFKALLHFIYTGSLQGTADLDGEEYNRMICHLLAAADMYAVDRLKLKCESILSKDLHVGNVATVFALAVQHSCDQLQKVCSELITSSDYLNSVVASCQSYVKLKRTYPAALGDTTKKGSKLRRT